MPFIFERAPVIQNMIAVGEAQVELALAREPSWPGVLGTALGALVGSRGNPQWKSRGQSGRLEALEFKLL